MCHLEIQLNPNLLLRLPGRDLDLLILLADPRQNVFHLLLPEEATEAVAGAAFERSA